MMDTMSADDRASLAAWLDVRDLGRMTRAARGWAEHSARRQAELSERLAASPIRQATPTWAMVTRPWSTHSVLARFGPHDEPVWRFAILNGPVTWSSRLYETFFSSRPQPDLRIHWIHQGRGPQGEWLDETTLERQWSAEPTWSSDDDYVEDDDDEEDDDGWETGFFNSLIF